ncbi:MAG: hypothetical protein M1819_006214 [Sarea resinae]|nr:MAG: hypothetical protein M1819_006214 [Sarea resinae]
MAHHARIEELSSSDSDSDPDVMDPSDFDPTEFANSIITPNNLPSFSASPSSSAAASASRAPRPGGPPEPQLQPQHPNAPTTTPEECAHFQSLYACYFDASRTRAQGRRVGRSQAVPNPLAREIVDAVQALGLGLQVVFEPGKTHPKDWSNPGRVRVLVKEDGRACSRAVKNKHHLYTLISTYLQAHPTTTTSPLRLRIAGLPTPKEPLPPPAVPRGWKINPILPLHSPALSGGGISDNFIKDMMAEMAGEGGGGGGSSGSGAVEGAKKKKEKKKAR